MGPANEGEVKDLLERVRGDHGPLKVVVHASGLKEQKPLAEQDEMSLAKVFGPKAYGAYYLHKYTCEDRLRCFVLFSSEAALFGDAEQASWRRSVRLSVEAPRSSLRSATLRTKVR